MFENSLLESSGTGRTRKPAAFAISFLLQSIVLTLAAAIPFIYAEPLPTRALMTFLIDPPSPPPPPAQPAKVTPAHVNVKVRPLPQTIIEPASIASMVTINIDPPLPPVVSGNVVSVPGGTGDPQSNRILDYVITPPPPPPTPPPSQPQPEIIPIGGQVAAAKLISQPKPIYPPLARQARIQGTVRLEAVISRDGEIENLTVISGHPLLIPAALEAVRRWRYQPTLLNGAPVEVVTTVDVNFTLGE